MLLIEKKKKKNLLHLLAFAQMCGRCGRFENTGKSNTSGLFLVFILFRLDLHELDVVFQLVAAQPLHLQVLQDAHLGTRANFTLVHYYS